ncbi:restriction endonuclease subunit S, partial [Sporolactobacillus vineae]
MSNWEYVELGDIAQIKGGKRLPKGEKLTKNRNNHPYIRVRDMNISKFVQLNQDIMYVDEKTQQKISKYTVRTNNIIISIVGTIGLVSKVHASLDNANLTENCAKIVNLNGVDSDFLYYYLSSVYGQYEIKKGIVGSTQPKFPIYNIERVKVHLPSMIIQKSIGYILSNLDEKIEINN